MGAFRVDPDGEPLMTCTFDGGVWRTGAGEVLYDGNLVHLGYGDLALVEEGVRRWAVLDTSTGALTPVPDLQSVELTTFRAIPGGGFWAVWTEWQAGPPELWEIGVDGSATLLGTYPELPTGIADPMNVGRLDGRGAFYQEAEDPDRNDVIVKRALDGLSVVVYSEAGEPLVKYHSSFYVTGP